jgi:Ca2+-binding RTX toxin-like protein
MNTTTTALFAGVLVVSTAVSGVGPAEATLPTCFGMSVTMMGTPGADTLIGEAGVSDVIYGAGGDDVIIGGEFYDDGTAADLLCGGPGADFVKGARGNDKLNGGDGNDRVDGSNGADLEQGNGGNDRVGAGSFADADRAADIGNGGDGRDELIGGWGKDRLSGGGGSDRLIDTECGGPTTLNGGAGNDYLESWSSSFEGWQANICDEVSDRVNGGGGTDAATVDRRDFVVHVERLTRITRLSVGGLASAGNSSGSQSDAATSGPGMIRGAATLWLHSLT